MTYFHTTILEAFSFCSFRSLRNQGPKMIAFGKLWLAFTFFILIINSKFLDLLHKLVKYRRLIGVTCDLRVIDETNSRERAETNRI